MAHCCQSSSDQGDVWKVRQSRLDFLCTKPLVYTSVITSLVMAILGALALLGFFYPTSVVGVFGELLGEVYAHTILGTGLVLFATIVAARCCHNRAQKEEKAQVKDDEASRLSSI